MTHNPLYDTNWPNYLDLYLHTVNAYNLRSQAGTFQDSAARSFNDLPDFIRRVSDYNDFIKLVKALILH